jgi:hypothetical protein
MEQYETAREKYQAALSKWKENPEGERPQEPDRPIMERALVDDTTVEALGPILLDNWRGVLILRDELAGWLGGFDRYSKAKRGGGDAVKYIEMHGGRSVVIDRRTGEPRTLYIPRAAVSIGGGVQPAILRRLMTEEHRDNGLFARILLAFPPRRPRRWTIAEPDEALTEEVQAVYDRLWCLTPGRDRDGESDPVIVPLTPEARDLFIAWVNDLGAEQYHLEGDLASAWSKLEGGAARLALIHHLVLAAAGALPSPEAGITAPSMEAGITLARWFGNEDRRIYAMMAEDAEAREIRETVELVARLGDPATARDLQRASRKYKRADDAEGALQLLVDNHCGCWHPVPPSPKGGAPTRVFVLARADYPSLNPSPNQEQEQDKYNAAPPLDELFERFWEAFPSGRKQGKGKARESFAKAVKKADPELIIAAAAEYAASPVGQGEYVKGPCPWLNQECWNDDRAAWNRGSNGTTDPFAGLKRFASR